MANSYERRSRSIYTHFLSITLLAGGVLFAVLGTCGCGEDASTTGPKQGTQHESPKRTEGDVSSSATTTPGKSSAAPSTSSAANQPRAALDMDALRKFLTVEQLSAVELARANENFDAVTKTWATKVKEQKAIWTRAEETEPSKSDEKAHREWITTNGLGAALVHSAAEHAIRDRGFVAVWIGEGEEETELLVLAADLELFAKDRGEADAPAKQESESDSATIGQKITFEGVPSESAQAQVREMFLGSVEGLEESVSRFHFQWTGDAWGATYLIDQAIEITKDQHDPVWNPNFEKVLGNDSLVICTLVTQALMQAVYQQDGLKLPIEDGALFFAFKKVDGSTMQFVAVYRPEMQGYFLSDEVTIIIGGQAQKYTMTNPPGFQPGWWVYPRARDGMGNERPEAIAFYQYLGLNPGVDGALPAPLASTNGSTVVRKLVSVPGFTYQRTETFSNGGQSHKMDIYRCEAMAQASGIGRGETAIDVEFVLVPGGTFLMGSPQGEEGRDEGEGPQHQVTVPSFLLARTEVTQRVWAGLAAKAGVALDPSKFKGQLLPVEMVNGDDCALWCAASNLELPSEAAWEYACRAGTTTRFSIGDAVEQLGGVAWFSDNSVDQAQSTSPVGQKRVNAFGLFDMHGNVEEICKDNVHLTYLGAPIDGSAWAEPGDADRPKDGGADHQVRGGSFNSMARHCRSAARGNVHDKPNFTLGFRPARSLP